MLTDKEENLKLRKPFEGLLEYMNDRLQNGMEDDGPDGMCEHNVYFGFGTDSVKHMAKIYVCPETYEILEEACHHILEYIDEEYPATEPIGRIVKSYEIDYTGGGIYLVVGQFVSGEWFSAATPDEDDSIGLYATEGQAQECLADDMEFLIMGDSAKYIMVWDEILTDYVEKNGDFSACVPKWREGLYKGV